MTKMRKFFIFIFPLFLLISCSTTQEDQPAEDLLATQVAVILTETANQATHTETETKVPMPTAT